LASLSRFLKSIQRHPLLHQWPSIPIIPITLLPMFMAIPMGIIMGTMAKIMIGEGTDTTTEMTNTEIMDVEGGPTVKCPGEGDPIFRDRR